MDPPEPGPLKLIIITCKTYLDCNINLELLAKKIKLDDCVIGKKLLGVIEEGFVKNKPKSSHTRKRIKPIKKNGRKDFSNQCTIIIKSHSATENDRKINLKIFGNGMIVITGGLSKQEAIDAINNLKTRIVDLTDTYIISNTINFTGLFPNNQSYLKYINKNYLVFLQLFSIFEINIDLRLDLVLNKKFISKYPLSDALCDPVGNELVRCSSPSDLEKYLMAIQIFNICHLYFSNHVLIDKLSDPSNEIHHIIRQLYDFKPVTLPITFDRTQFEEEFTVSIENYNTMFHSGFHNNRELLTQILNDKYKKNGTIASAKFEPSNYQGINVKYISRILCSHECDSCGKKRTSKCSCKEVSFLIFQEGNVIITGGRAWEQVMDGYNIITNILKTEYHNIVVENDPIGPHTDQDLPTTLTKHTSHGDVVYINKKRQILENPRNMYLLKNIGLLDKYLV
jgi:hypothetical protein